MNGHIVNGTNIAVDYWKIQGRGNNFVHFLTHLHGDHIVGLTSSWHKPIYCSEFTAQLLTTRHGLPSSLLRICELNQSRLVSEPGCQSFTVTAYDANHCPGAVMFYFQGDFGNILYTGDFRSSPQLIETCGHLVGNVDILYLDNTFCSPKCVFPSRYECLSMIVNVIRQHPFHRVLIGVRKLGKESLLAEIGVALNEIICVSPACYYMSQMLFTTDVFTTSSLGDTGRIRTVPMHTINRRFIEELNVIQPTIAIIPSAIFTGLNCQPYSQDSNIFLIPYSDHCSYVELMEFVSVLRPARVLPIVQQQRGPFGVDISDRTDMSCFQSFLLKNRPGKHNVWDSRLPSLRQFSETTKQSSTEGTFLKERFGEANINSTQHFSLLSVCKVEQIFRPCKKPGLKRCARGRNRSAARAMYNRSMTGVGCKRSATGVVYVDCVADENLIEDSSIPQPSQQSSDITLHPMQQNSYLPSLHMHSHPTQSTDTTSHPTQQTPCLTSLHINSHPTKISDTTSHPTQSTDTTSHSTQSTDTTSHSTQSTDTTSHPTQSTDTTSHPTQQNLCLLSSDITSHPTQQNLYLPSSDITSHPTQSSETTSHPTQQNRCLPSSDVTSHPTQSSETTLHPTQQNLYLPSSDVTSHPSQSSETTSHPTQQNLYLPSSDIASHPTQSSNTTSHPTQQNLYLPSSDITSHPTQSSDITSHPTQQKPCLTSSDTSRPTQSLNITSQSTQQNLYLPSTDTTSHPAQNSADTSHPTQILHTTSQSPETTSHHTQQKPFQPSTDTTSHPPQSPETTSDHTQQKPFQPSSDNTSHPAQNSADTSHPTQSLHTTSQSPETTSHHTQQKPFQPSTDNTSHPAQSLHTTSHPTQSPETTSDHRHQNRFLPSSDITSHPTPLEECLVSHQHSSILHANSADLQAGDYSPNWGTVGSVSTHPNSLTDNAVSGMLVTQHINLLHGCDAVESTSTHADSVYNCDIVEPVDTHNSNSVHDCNNVKSTDTQHATSLHNCPDSGKNNYPEKEVCGFVLAQPNNTWCGSYAGKRIGFMKIGRHSGVILPLSLTDNNLVNIVRSDTTDSPNSSKMCLASHDSTGMSCGLADHHRCQLSSIFSGAAHLSQQDSFKSPRRNSFISESTEPAKAKDRDKSSSSVCRQPKFPSAIQRRKYNVLKSKNNGIGSVRHFILSLKEFLSKT